MFFELNYGYHLYMSYEKAIEPQSKPKAVQKLSTKLYWLILVCCNNFFYTQKREKPAYDKEMKYKIYALGDKIWLNNKFIKTI